MNVMPPAPQPVQPPADARGARSRPRCRPPRRFRCRRRCSRRRCPAAEDAAGADDAGPDDPAAADAAGAAGDAPTGADDVAADAGARGAGAVVAVPADAPAPGAPVVQRRSGAADDRAEPAAAAVRGRGRCDVQRTGRPGARVGTRDDDARGPPPYGQGRAGADEPTRQPHELDPQIAAMLAGQGSGGRAGDGVHRRAELVDQQVREDRRARGGRGSRSWSGS